MCRFYLKKIVKSGLFKIVGFLVIRFWVCCFLKYFYVFLGILVVLSFFIVWIVISLWENVSNNYVDSFL